MVGFISSWAQQIIFAVIIGVIIQMLLPESKSKKYIKVIIGVYVLFSVISPVVGKDIDLNLNEFNLNISQNTSTIETNVQNNINDIYITNLKQDVISKLKNKGYGCKNVNIEVSDNYDVKQLKIDEIYEIEEDDSNKENSDSTSKVNTVIINEVQIGEKDNSIKEQVTKGIPSSDEKELKEYLSETYGVEEKNISIN